jgi:tRNA A-37 threonylcarbamoyl transferase component Bud32
VSSDPDEQRDLEIVALTRLGLTSALGLVSALPGDLVGGLARSGKLTEMQAIAVRAYVAQYEVLCPCGRRSLAPENATAFRCSACGVSLVRRSSGGSWGRGPEAKAPGVGARIGPLELEKVLGKGASGTVYQARHVQLGRLSAVKVVAAAALDKSRRTRFDRELEALGRLNHPGIVTLHAAFEHEGSLVYEMDLIEGETLEDVLHRGALPWRDAANLIARIAEAVEHAHRAGVLHRDLKPANVLVRRRDGAPLVADFGLARLSDQTSSLTRAGTWVGTPAYMAPEALSGNTSEASDVYGLGAILYEALTGKPPFQEENPHALFYRVTNGKCDPTKAPGAPADLERVRARAMAPDPGDRYRSAGELAADLRRLASGESVSLPRRISAVALACVLVVVLLAFALRTLRTSEPDPPPPPALASVTTLEGALAALAARETDPARRSGALRTLAKLGDAVTVAALDTAVLGAPSDLDLRRLRWGACRRTAAPLDASDLDALADHADAQELEALASYAVSHGIKGSDPAAIRQLRARHPASRGLASLAGVVDCMAGDPSLRDEAMAALRAGKPLEEQAQRLARAMAETDAFCGLLVGGSTEIPTAAERLARELREAAAFAPRSPRVILASMPSIARNALSQGHLTDATHPDQARGLVLVLESVPEELPPLLLALDAIVRDRDPETPGGAKWPPERLAAAAEALAATDPVLAAAAFECAAGRARGRSGWTNDPAAIVSWYQRAFALLRNGAGTTDFDSSWGKFVARRCSTGLGEVEENLAEAFPAERVPRLERALAHVQESLVLCRENQGLGRSLELDTGFAVKLLFSLDRVDEAVALSVRLPHAGAIAAEAVRRKGDPRRAADLARAALEKAEAKVRTDWLAILALSLADQGDGEGAWRLMPDLAAAEALEGALIPGCSQGEVRAYLTRKVPR